MRLVAALRTPETPAALSGALRGLLEKCMTVSQARAIAAQVVDEGCFDSPAALGDLTCEALEELDIPVGRRRRILQACFGDPVAVPRFRGEQDPADPVRVVVPEGRLRTLKVSWPAPESKSMPSPESMMDFGMGLRGFLRSALPTQDAIGDPVLPGPWADAVFRVFTNPWDDLPPTHVDGDQRDQSLCSALLGAPGALPPWAAALVRQQLKEDRGLSALLALCRQVFTNTDTSNAGIKKAVRAPARESDPANVAKRLAL